MTARRLDQRQFGLCCLTVLAALLPHATWLPVPFLGLLLALIALRWLQRTRLPRPWPWWFTTGLMLSLFAAAWLAIGTISGTQGAGFLAAMMVSKLFEAERPRDARAVATFASFLVMAQFLVQSQLWAMMAGLPGIVLAIATLASLHRPPGSTKTSLLRPLGRASALVLTALPLAVTAFVLFPRLSSPLWGNTFVGQRGGMGLSDRMEPGQIGSIAMDERTAMRVRFPDGVPPNAIRYFRGLTLWSTDGRSWTRPLWANAPLSDLPPVPDRGIRHEITLEPDAAPWLPALDRPIAAPAELRLALDGSLPIPLRRRRELRYEVVSDPDLALEPFGLPWQIRSLSLELPENANPRTHALARRLRAESADDHDYASRLMRLFTREFGYSLEPPPLGRHAVDEFLFDTKSGYCEHYASAYATLLRAGGVPARVVLGFQGGYYNAAGGYLVVRRSDAHAWVEAWIEGRGWLRADPTSMVAPERIDRGSDALSELADGFLRATGLWRWLYDQWDYLELRWTDWVTNYRRGDRLALLGRLVDAARSLLGNRQAVLALAGLLVIAFIVRILRRSAFRRAASDRDAAWLHRFRRVLASGGIDSTPAESAAVVAERAIDRFPGLAGAVGGLALQYQRARYAPGESRVRPPSHAALAKLWLKLAVERVRRAISAERPAEQTAGGGS